MSNTVPDNWYETFFAGINCEMWRKALPEEWSEKEASFLIDVMNIKRGANTVKVKEDKLPIQVI